MKWRYLIWPWRQKWRSFQDFVINRLHFFFRILFFVKNPYIQRSTLFIMSLLEEFIVIWRLNVSIEKKCIFFYAEHHFSYWIRSMLEVLHMFGWKFFTKYWFDEENILEKANKKILHQNFEKKLNLSQISSIFCIPEFFK